MKSVCAPILVGVALSLSLAACTNAKKSLGLVKDPPDEFAVVTRAPLSLPPDYNLRPPAPGAPRPQEAAVSAQARETVFGRDGQRQEEPARPLVTLASNAPAGPAVTASPQQSVSRLTVGESAILRMTGADGANAQIRQVVDKESAILADAGETFLDRLLDFREPLPPGTVIDASAEARRLRENQALGKPVTDGPSPNIERKERGLLEGLF